MLIQVPNRQPTPQTRPPPLGNPAPPPQSHIRFGVRALAQGPIVGGFSGGQIRVLNPVFPSPGAVRVTTPTYPAPAPLVTTQSSQRVSVIEEAANAIAAAAAASRGTVASTRGAAAASRGAGAARGAAAASRSSIAAATRISASASRGSAAATSASSPASVVNEMVVYVSSDEDENENSSVSGSSSSSGSSNSSSLSVEGVEGSYYGGYGECFKGGRRGHWALGCPFQINSSDP